jgi:uncharacterized membrane protein YbhN (UPF0104 family)
MKRGTGALVNWRERLPRLRRAGIWAVVASAAAYAVVGVVFDGGQVAAHGLPALQRPWLLPLVLLMAPLNYLLRFIKWHAYTRRLGFVHVPWRGNLVVFLSGLGLTLTPGKVGELVKSWMLWERYGVPAARSAPMIVADRITDGCAMLALASLGAVLLGRGRVPWLLIVAIVALIALLRSRRVMLPLLRLAARLPRLGALEHQLHELLDSGQALLEPDIFAYALGLGLVGWGLEGLIVYLALGMFGYPLSVGASLLVVASAAIAGGVSALPGGVGAAEGVMVGLLLWLGVPLSLAVLTTLITRFSTLWLGVAIGLVCLGAAQAGERHAA